MVLWALVLCVPWALAEDVKNPGIYEGLSSREAREKFYLFHVVLSRDSMHRRTDLQKHGLAFLLTKQDVEVLSEEQLSWFPESADHILQSKMSKKQLARRGLLVQRQFVVDGKVQKLEGRIHHFGEGFIAPTAAVDDTVYVAKGAAVLDYAQARDYVKIRDKAVLKGHALVKDDVILKNRAVVEGHAIVSHYAVVQGHAHIRDHAQVSDRALVEGRALLTDYAQMSDHSRASNYTLLRGHSQLKDMASVAGYTVMEHYAVAKGSVYFRDGCLSGHACVWGKNNHKVSPFPGNNTGMADLNHPVRKFGRFCSTVFKEIFRM